MDSNKIKQILRDVVDGVSVKDSTVKYDGEALALRQQIAKETKDTKGFVAIHNEWPDFTDEEWGEILARRGK